MHILSLTGEWQFRKSDSETWLPAHVPGGVHTDLLAQGLIPDPFVADNEKRVLWVAESDWVYRRTFTVDAAMMKEERIFLICEGLDTLAEVTLNGVRLGTTDNMFRRYTWDIKSLLRTGEGEENELLILFRSPVQYVTAKMAERPLRGVSQAIEGGPYLRKAPCQFGWDWGPQLPPIGIWKDIRIEGRSHARVANVYLRQQHAKESVTVTATITVERWTEAPLMTIFEIINPQGQVRHAQADVTGDTLTLSIEVKEPELWWPNGYGEQPLYDIDVLLFMNKTTCDIVHYRIGLRTLELRREPDAWGESFTFVVNGVPIFAKGSNWIPADSFPTRITDAFLEQLIRDAAATHQNMLRVWGGGFYEEDRFYDLCDKYGLLVWQDCIYSCSIYPMWDETFIENTRIETIENVRRLRHHPSLALWCGNNEMEAGWVFWGWDRPENADLKADYDRFFHHLLPAWIAAEDPDRTYWPSSPSTGIPFQPPHGQERGDAHYWDVWHGGKPFSAYRGQYPRFMSEFGFQALPPLETIRTYADEADWNMTSYIMEHHQRSASGNGKMIAHMTDHFRMPKDFPSLVYLSQMLQAEGIRFGVEHWRRNRERVSGTLYWQLNDCWPVASWSSLDYYGRWKALHYAAKRFYAPVLLSIEDVGTVMGIHVTSDLQQPWQGVVRWSLQTLGGEELAAGVEPVTAAPLASTHVRTLNFGDRISDDNCREVIFVCELWQGDVIIARRVATFVPDKHLSLVEPRVTATVSQKGDTLIFEVTAQSLARFVELALAGVDVVFSDNYFDVPAGRTVTVTCPLPADWTLNDARLALRIRSLYDSFA
ncbi:MAG TPA: glycoside hydrolase family 2 protein [Anaerolineae bacterium]|nr:glycoside hydrolase family 2 protein [Anaerolineae bacterium]HQK15467.1 glycoside hydrolase family 2 protein [Anaerolineae bacterium]